MMLSTTTTTNPADAFLRNVNDVGTVLFRVVEIGLPVVLVLAIVASWLGVLPTRDGFPGWHEDDRGEVHGPRLHRWRIRRAFRPLVERRPRHRPTTIDEWRAYAEHVNRRADRKARRVWGQMEQALQFPSRFVDFTITPEGREWLVKSAIDPSDSGLSRRFDELDVMAPTSRLTAVRDDDRPSHFRVTISDAHAEPITVPLAGVGFVRDQLGRMVRRRLTAVVGHRWVSLYDPALTWQTTDDDVDAAYTSAPATIITDRSPIGGRDVSRGYGGDRSPDPDPLTAPGNGETGTVALPSSYLRVLAVLADGSLTAQAVADAVARDVANVRRTLRGMARRRLVESIGSAWALTDDGRQLAADVSARQPTTNPDREVTP